VHSRLILYKRIASAGDAEALQELQVEMIDRFGLLPDPVRNLFGVTELKLQALPLGIRKIEVGPQGGRLLFAQEARADPARIIGLIQSDPARYRFEGPERLRFAADLPTAQSRFGAVSDILRTIASEEALEADA
jgi:transcription-repair coupling factor (superfamily II helicase)